jgi:hypothetical protein
VSSQCPQSPPSTNGEGAREIVPPSSDPIMGRLIADPEEKHEPRAATPKPGS